MVQSASEAENILEEMIEREIDILVIDNRQLEHRQKGEKFVPQFLSTNISEKMTSLVINIEQYWEISPEENTTHTQPSNFEDVIDQEFLRAEKIMELTNFSKLLNHTFELAWLK